MEFRNTQIAPPKNWQEFEDLCLAVFKRVWADPLAQKNGRAGQSQHGVDVWGTPKDEPDTYRGVQCKGKDTGYGKPATIGEFDRELAKADTFQPALRQWLFVTTSPKDEKLEEHARLLTAARKAAGLCVVKFLGWGDIQLLIADHPAVLEQFYPEHANHLNEVREAIKKLATQEDISRLRDLLSETHRTERSELAGTPSTWEVVSFIGDRTLVPALMGRPLGPVDANACPRLPEADLLVSDLRSSYSARLIGEPGAGKSVCAYQAAQTLATSGWKIVRLKDPRMAPQTFAVECEPVPTVFLIDDAHLSPETSIRHLEEATGPNRYLLTTFNIQGTQLARGAVLMNAKEAVRIIANDLRRNRSSTLELVRRVDEKVDDYPLSESLDQRLEHALEVSDRPWQFCFVLAGGWRRTSKAIANARSKGFELVLAAAAMRQIASRDEVCSRHALADLLGNCDQLDDAIEWLVHERNLLSPDDLRTPHQRFSGVLVARILTDQSSEPNPELTKLFHTILNDAQFSLLGIRNLFSAFRYNSEFQAWKRLTDRSKVGSLIQRAWEATGTEERSGALWLLAELSSFVDDWADEIIKPNLTVLTDWINEYAPPLGNPLANLANSLWRDHTDLLTNLFAKVEPQKMAQVVTAVTPYTAFDIGRLTDTLMRYCQDGWLEEFRRHLDLEALKALGANWPDDSPLYALIGLAQPLDWKIEGIGLDIVERAMPAIHRAFERNLFETYSDIDHSIYSLFRIMDPFGEPSSGAYAPSARSRELSKKLIDGIDLVKAARVISATPKREFQRAGYLVLLIRTVSKTKAAELMRLIDWGQIEATLADDWANMFHDANAFLSVSCGDRFAKTMIDGMITRHLSQIEIMPSRFAFISNAAAFKHIENGKIIGISYHGHFEWETAGVLTAIFKHDRPDLVDRLMQPHETAASEVLSQQNSSWFKEATLCLRIFRDIYPAGFERILDGVDPLRAVNGWRDCLKKDGKAARAVAILVEATLGRADDLGKMSRGLRAEFPQRSIPKPKDAETITLD